MRAALQRVSLAVAMVVGAAWGGVDPAAARIDCAKNPNAVCVDLAAGVSRYEQLVWAICDADSATVCKCYDAQQGGDGIDWCQWTDCACSSLTDATLKTGACGLATACGSLAAVKRQRQALAEQSAPARLGAQVEQVRAGHVVDCSPEACMAVGPICMRATGALEILKDQGGIKDGAACAASAKDAVAFGKRLHVEGLTPAIAACACAAVF
jgi:hypothetical protein